MDDIKGAFGINFGDVYNEKRGDTCKKLAFPVRKECSFIPAKPNEKFKQYIVASSGLENIVFKIVARKYMGPYAYNECLKKGEVTSNILERKYGTPFITSEGSSGGASKYTAWRNYNKNSEAKGIILFCFQSDPEYMGTPDEDAEVQFEIEYTDLSFLKGEKNSRYKARFDDTGL